MEDGHPDGSLFWVNNVAGLFFIFPVPAIRRSSRPDGQPNFNPCLPAPIGVLDNLVSFGLGAPRQDGADKLASQAVIDILADAHDFRPSAFDLLKDHRRVNE